jgi:Tol biopolymer transport system component
VGTGHDRVVTEDGGLFSWSPGGDRIVFSGRNDSGIYVFDLDNGGLEALWEDERLTFGAPAWQPGGESIAVPVLDSTVSSSSKGVYVVAVATGKRRKVVDGTPVSVHWSPDGEKLVFSPTGTGGNQIWMVDVEDGSLAKLLDRTATFGDPAWSNDGSALLLAVEEASERSYWITVMAVADHSLAKLALANTMLPFSTW